LRAGDSFVHGRWGQWRARARVPVESSEEDSSSQDSEEEEDEDENMTFERVDRKYNGSLKLKVSKIKIKKD